MSMANRPHAFKHRDVVRIVKAASAAGVTVGQVTVDPRSGAVTVGPAQGVSGNDLDQWMANKKVTKDAHQP